MARQEGDSLVPKSADYVGARRLAERRDERPLLPIGQLVHVVQATSADDANLNCHCFFPCRGAPPSRPDAFPAVGYAGNPRGFPSSSLMYPAIAAGSCSK